jgi:hypothetical protein
MVASYCTQIIRGIKENKKYHKVSKIKSVNSKLTK